MDFGNPAKDCNMAADYVGGDMVRENMLKVHEYNLLGIDKSVLSKLDPNYSEAFNKVTNFINDELKRSNDVKPEQVSQIQNSLADYTVPFHVPDSTEFKPLDPKSNTEPLFAPAQPGETTKTVVTVNAKAYML